MIVAFILQRPDGKLVGHTLTAERSDAEQNLKKEFPAGHIIYPDHKVRTVMIEVLND